MKHSITLAILCAAVPGLHAQVSDQMRQATISGSRGTSGKCTVEVRVDTSAEVDIYGGSGRLRTLAGQPATWNRLDCTDPLPYNMSDFRFRGVDGRGNVQLVQDPRNNRGMAVIRIEDPKSGSEGYTFDIEWSGASGGAPTGFPGGGYQRGYPPGGFGGNTGVYPNQRGAPGMSAERAIDLCRSEVRARAEREYNLRNIDITAAAVDTHSGRRDSVSGTFNDRSGGRHGGAYRFNCAVDYNSGQVQAIQILRPDGAVLQPGTAPGAYNAPYNNQTRYDQNRVFRACQDAVVARASRDGYRNVNFSSTAVENNNNGRVAGTMTASRGPVTDTFNFNCSMDFGTAAVRNVQVNRR